MIYKDYQEYLKEQKVRAESKWGRKPEFNDLFIKNLKDTLNKVNVGQPKEICCMGVRDGTELFVFKELFPKADVLGVDITENIETIKTDNKVKVVLQDFNLLPEDWNDKFDLVFSNSLDHAYSPSLTVFEWYRAVKNGGYILVELSTHNETNIEHMFKWSELPILFPSAMFEHTNMWRSPKRKIITGLFKVVKNGS